MRNLRALARVQRETRTMPGMYNLSSPTDKWAAAFSGKATKRTPTYCHLIGTQLTEWSGSPVTRSDE